MSSVLCLTVRFLDPLPRFHGRSSGGDPEWPPSPLRFFQALVAAAAARWRPGQFRERAGPAFQWLEKQRLVVLGAVPKDRSVGYRMYVPNNSGDLMTAAWARGATATSMAEFRVEKDVLPTQLLSDDLHYLVPLNGDCPHFDTLRDAARSITHLGWGVDMVAGDATILSTDDAPKLLGETWRPTIGRGTPLRVPVAGTLEDLMSKHNAFLHRLTGDGFKPVPPLSKFAIVHYRRATDPVPRPFAAFSILKPDASGNRAFDTARRCKDVAGWMRHAVGEVCRGWPHGDIEGFVHGHDGPGKPLKGERANERFMYLPLPSIERRGDLGRHVGAIRRVLITAPPGFSERVEWVRRRLAGWELVSDGRGVGILNILPTSDWVLQQYTRAARVWSTVTPVVWPGHDDRDERKAEAILRRAFEQAGLAAEVVAGIQELDWRSVGFRAGVYLAQRYLRPEHMTGRVCHVRVRFSHPVAGPLAVGAGRYRGFGLFAVEE